MEETKDFQNIDEMDSSISDDIKEIDLDSINPDEIEDDVEDELDGDGDGNTDGANVGMSLGDEVGDTLASVVVVVYDVDVDDARCVFLANHVSAHLALDGLCLLQKLSRGAVVTELDDGI